MKKIVSIILILTMVFSLVACNQNNQSSPSSTTTDTKVEKSSKVAIITNTLSQNEEEYRSAQEMVEKYPDRVIHELWPDNFMTEQEQMVSIVAKIASNQDIKALIVNQAVPGTNAAVDKLLETRDDMLIIYCTPGENNVDVANRASIVLQPDELSMGDTIPAQAQKLGAKTLVHYSFPRHMSYPLLSARRELMKEKCKEIGLEFVDATAPDPTGDAGVPGSQQFILEDVPKKVNKYGKDTAFFSTNCSMQVPLIAAVVDTGAIYPQPCCPSPFHGFPAALGLELTDEQKGDINYVVGATREKLEEKNVLGRFSTWPVPVSMMFTIAGTEYAIKWMDGETNGKCDTVVLNKCMSDYAGVNINYTNYEENGKSFDNYFLVLMDFLTY